MTEDEYVRAVLQKYSVPTGPYSPAELAANRIAPSIRQWAGNWLSELRFSGSYAKGTAVSTATDVDLFVSLDADTQGSLKDIYESLYSFSSKQGWAPRRQNVSIKVSFAGIKVDLVPGRIQKGHLNVHSLYRRRTDSWAQTNVSLHIERVRQSGRTEEVRAMKIWRDLHRVEFPSFYLELVVLEATKGCRVGSVASNFLRALAYVRDWLPTVRFVDPANSNNVVSDDLSPSEKKLAAASASMAAAADSWEKILW